MRYYRGFKKKLHLASCILIFLAAGCKAFPFPSPESSAKPITSTPLSWETYLRDSGRSSAGDEIPAGSLSSYWSFNMRDMFNVLPFYPMQNSSPAVVDDIAYFGSMDSAFYALDLKNKDVLWRFKTTGAVESSPAVYSNKVYFGTNDGIFYCLDAKNGKEVWQFKIRTSIISSPLAAGSNIYFSSVDDRLYALNASTGEKIWHYSRGSVKRMIKRQYASPSYHNNKIYMLFSDGYLVGMDALSGKVIWNRKIGGDSSIYIRSTPTINNRMLYVLNDDGILAALDAESGDERWRFDGIKAVDFAIKKNAVFLLHPDGQVFAVNKITGENLWRRKVTKGNPVSIIIAGSYIVIASNYSSTLFDIEMLTAHKSYVDIFAIDSGERVWTEEMDSHISTTPVAAYNKLLFAVDKGRLYVYKGK